MQMKGIYRPEAQGRSSSSACLPGLVCVRAIHGQSANKRMHCHRDGHGHGYGHGEFILATY
jgi:hypothetical protein